MVSFRQNGVGADFIGAGAILPKGHRQSPFSVEELAVDLKRKPFEDRLLVNALLRASRLTAKIDNSANCGLLSDLSPQLCCNRSEWAVAQQGLNDTTGMARRYHWQSASAHDFVAELHNAASPDQPSRNASS